MSKRRFASLAACLFALPAFGQNAPTVDPTSFEGGHDAVAAARARMPGSKRARNVILFVGDGMGIGTVTAARIYEGQLRGASGEENQLAFDPFPHVGLVKTYNTNQQTPDSAGTMSAIVTGTKTRAGVLSIGRDAPRGDFEQALVHRLPTLLENAEERGLATGIVTTTTVTHATPGALYAHSPERSWESDDDLPEAARAADFPDIARQLIEFEAGDGVDIVLGGGSDHFLPALRPELDAGGAGGNRLDGRDLIREWVAGREGAGFVANRTELLAFDPTTSGPLLGLFAPGHLAFEIDRAAKAPEQPSLSEMTGVAIRALEKNADGYFLTVEGGRIDHAHHAGNARRALHDTVEFSNAVRTALELTNPEDTLIIVTADHDHVMTFGGYPTRGNDILGKVVGNDPAGEPEQNFSVDSTGRPYTTIGYQNGPGARRTVATVGTSPIHAAKGAANVGPRLSRRPDLSGTDTTHVDFLQEAAVPMTYETHSGEDVAVYATGPGSELFGGVVEQNYLYHAIVDALGWNRRSLLDPKKTPPTLPKSEAGEAAPPAAVRAGSGTD